MLMLQIYCLFYIKALRENDALPLLRGLNGGLVGRGDMKNQILSLWRSASLLYKDCVFDVFVMLSVVSSSSRTSVNTKEVTDKH